MRHRARGPLAALCLIAVTSLASCTSSGGSSSSDTTVPTPATADGAATTVPVATVAPAAVPASSQVSGVPDTSGASSTVAAAPAATPLALPPGAVTVTFDTPGDDPRPIKETPADITGTPTVLGMDITGITYRGVVCGFTFRGARPASPVTIRMTGTAGGLGFDSGEVKVTWTGDQVTADSSSDERGGWNFLADATPSRSGNAQGWVIQLGAIPKSTDRIELPTGAACSLTSSTPLSASNGPVGYWAGFATR